MKKRRSTRARDVYMDYNATTPVRDEALEIMREAFREGFGNPSSVHYAGRRAKKILDEAREKLASTMSARASEIIFTAGGSESANLAIKGMAAGRNSGHVVTTVVEHPAVLETCRTLTARGVEVSFLPVDGEGRVDPQAVRDEIRPDTFLVCVMWVNNETGVIQPVEAVGDIARDRGVLFFSDAVQAYPRLPVDVSRTPIDMLSISGHKLNAPMGVGALYVRSGIELAPFVDGGGQERRLRSGTENIPAIAALGEAGRLAHAEMEKETERVGKCRDRLEAGILAGIPRSTVNGAGAARVANTANVRFAGANGEEVVLALDEKRIAVSSASACAATHTGPSHVLTAMGLSRLEAEECVRFSLGRYSSEEDVDVCLSVLPGIVERIRSVRAAGR